MLIAHENWTAAGIFDRLSAAAGKRSLDDLTCSPVLSWPTPRILAHIDACLAIPGARLVFGGKPLTGHSIPECYGAVEPTAVFIPLKVPTEDRLSPTIPTGDRLNPMRPNQD